MTPLLINHVLMIIYELHAPTKSLSFIISVLKMCVICISFTIHHRKAATAVLDQKLALGKVDTVFRNPALRGA
jgi:hypothetical protein